MISFVIPAYNEETELPSTIAAIQRAADSGAKQPYEIIVVNDASNDSTAEVAAVAGARVISINRRQIAASRNAGARTAHGRTLFFVDADTRISPSHVTDALAALSQSYAGGSARVQPDGFVPVWGRVFVRAFSSVYFGLNFGAGAFLFTTRRSFDAVGGFDEQYFIGEEVYFSLALRKLGRFKVLAEPVLTSGRKLRMYLGPESFDEIFLDNHPRPAGGSITGHARPLVRRQTGSFHESLLAKRTLSPTITARLWQRTRRCWA